MNNPLSRLLQAENKPQKIFGTNLKLLSNSKSLSMMKNHPLISLFGISTKVMFFMSIINADTKQYNHCLCSTITVSKDEITKWYKLVIKAQQGTEP